LPLAAAELYDLENDPEESYDMAPENAAVVRDIQARVERLIGTFPEPIQKAYAETKGRTPGKNAVGQYAR
jgi:hypothetical protein